MRIPIARAQLRKKRFKNRLLRGINSHPANTLLVEDLFIWLIGDIFNRNTIILVISKQIFDDICIFITISKNIEILEQNCPILNLYYRSCLFFQDCIFVKFCSYISHQILKRLFWWSWECIDGHFWGGARGSAHAQPHACSCRLITHQFIMLLKIVCDYLIDIVAQKFADLAHTQGR